MAKERASKRIDAPSIDPNATAAIGEVFDYIESIAPPALSVVEAPSNIVLSTLLSRSAGTPTAIVSATWDAPDGVDIANLTYLIQWSTDSTFATNTNGATAFTNSASIDFLTTGTTYYFRVAANYRTIQSPYSASASIATAVDTTPPAVPTSVAWTWGANGDLDVTWTDPTSANLKAVEVLIWNSAGKTVFYRGLAVAPGVQRARWTAAMNSQDTGTVYDAAVYIEVRALSWGGIYSTTNAVPGAQPSKAVPSTPAGLTTTWAGDTGAAGEDVTITWTAQADAIKFRLTIDGQIRELAATSYTYTYKTNQAEHSATPDPVLTIGLVAVDGLNQASTSATATATNAAPATTSASLFGGFATFGIAITGSVAADVRDYTIRVIKDGSTAATYTTIQVNQIYSVTASGSYQIGIKVNDLFGQASSETVSSAVVIDTLTIAELRANASYIDDLGTSSATLNTLKDAITNTGGLAIGSGIATTWHYVKAIRSELDRYLTMTISASAGVGYVGVSTDDVTYTWYSGPLVSGRTLTAVASEAAAQAAAIALPLSASIMRWELPSMAEARYIKLGHKNTSAVAYSLYEFYPRRLVEGDDIRGESITALNIAAGTITGDRLVATAIDAFTITGATIQTATSGARVVLSAAANGGFIGYGASDTYNVATGTGTYQVRWSKLDGSLYAGGGAVVISSAGIKFDAAGSGASEVTWANSATGVTALAINATYSTNAANVNIISGVGWSGTVAKYGQIQIRATARTAGVGANNLNWNLYIGAGTDPGGQWSNGWYFNRYDVSSGVFTNYLSITGSSIFGGGLNVGSLSSGASDNQLRIGNSTYTLYYDSGNSGYRTDGNFLVNGNIYWGSGGNFLSAYLNQAVLTTSTVSFTGLSVSNPSVGNASYFGYAAPALTLGNGTTFAGRSQSVWLAMATASGHYFAGTAAGDGILFTQNNGGGVGALYLGVGALAIGIGAANNLAIANKLYIGGLGTVPAYQIELSTNSAGKPGTNTWTISSDRRVKDELGAYSEGLATLQQLRPIRFRYNGKNGTPADGVEYVGMIAQEVAEVAPAMITSVPGEIDGQETDILQLDSHNLTYMLLNAVVELASRVEALEQRPRRKKAA